MAVVNETGISGPLYANGVTTVFPFDCVVASAEELTVEVDSAVLNPDDYVVTLSEDFTGSVTISPALAAGEIYIYSAPNFKQETVFQRFGPFYPDQANAPFDRAAIRDIYLRGLISALVDLEGAFPTFGSKAPVFQPNLTGGLGTTTTAYRFNVDFFNPTDDFIRAANLVNNTDTATGDGKIRSAHTVNNVVNATRTNGPAQASVGQTIRSIKPDYLTTSSTQEVDGLYIQTKTGVAGDSSAILADAVGRDGGTNFVNILEGSSSVVDGSGVATRKIRWQAATIDGPGSFAQQYYAEKGAHNYAILINGTSAADRFEYYIYAQTNNILTYAVDKDGNSTQTGAISINYPTAGEPTYKGLIRLNNPIGTLDQDTGIEFKSGIGGAGYGWRIAAPDRGSDNTPLLFQRRKNSAVWADSIEMTPNGSFRTPEFLALNFASDALAAAGGVAVGEWYHTSGAIKVRMV